MLELKDLVFSVNIKDEKNNDQKIDIIKGINFKFEKGKFYAITGPNGSGKTTLAKLIMGINRQTGGNIFFEDKDITELSITERAKLGISYSFQHPA
ncbi:MAG TPA: ATP-binding cassette domain-containing protein, partial [Smithellaceae bacterium]|nr:ATP-binding cassette domain-containing protein [Smithellaceae bacterium]